MLAENLVSSPGPYKLLSSCSPQEARRIQYKEGEDDKGTASGNTGMVMLSLLNLFGLAYLESSASSYSSLHW